MSDNVHETSPREIRRQHIMEENKNKSCGCQKQPYTSFGVPYDPDMSNDVSDLQTKITRVFRSHVNRVIRSYDIDIACDAYELAKDLLLDKYGTWLYLRNAPTIHGTNLSFVEDTQNYIIYGKRSCELATWLFILKYGDASHDKEPSRLIESDSIIRGNPTTDLLKRWIKQDKGLDDLLYTMYAFYCGDPMRV